jgi:hypothetical protein
MVAASYLKMCCDSILGPERCKTSVMGPPDAKWKWHNKCQPGSLHVEAPQQRKRVWGPTKEGKVPALKMTAPQQRGEATSEISPSAPVFGPTTGPCVTFVQPPVLPK